MKTLTVGIVLACILAITASFIPAGAQTEGDLFGSIAYSPSTGKIGTAVDWPSKEAAEQAALSQCGEMDCKAYQWFKNTCGVFTRGDDGALGWAWDSDKALATEKAIDQCRQVKGVNCKPIAGVCTSKLGRPSTAPTDPAGPGSGWK